jgi:diaminohydroxyphosphoribosylaminopyrimidine deaminase/5-amino-6-(5-phosphoribosylamino)uracil reductase
MQSNEYFMRRAIELARQGLGRTAPNPCVGAVLVRNKTIVAEGWHRASGQAHAEIEALADARRKGIHLQECSLYVTLEPCNHEGKTPPCSRAIVDAGIPEVIIGCADPNPVAAGGIEFLRCHGVTVTVGILEQECRDLVADFLVWTQKKRPFVMVKLATTLDGKIATRTGHSAWISNEISRQKVHAMRAWSNAIMVGSGTFRQDNPSLTCRLENFTGPQPIALIVTTHLPEAPEKYTLLASRPRETIFLTTMAESISLRAEGLKELGVQVWGLPSGKHGLDLEQGLCRLFQECHCYYVLAEGGGRLSSSLYQQGLLDELHMFQAMKILGDEQGKAVFSGREVLFMDDAWPFRLLDHQFLDTDLYLRLRP